MSKYHFFFKTGNKAYSLKLEQKKLEQKKLEQNSESEPLRILCENSDTKMELLSLEKKGIKLVAPSEGYGSDKKVNVSSYNYNLQNPLQLTITLSDGPEKNSASGNTEVFPTDAALKIIPSKKNYQIKCEGGAGKCKSYVIKIEYKTTSGTTSGTYTGKIQFDFVPKEQIYDVVLDFGSEASQMLLRKRGTDSSEPVELFKACFDYFYKGDEGYPDYQNDKNIGYLQQSIAYNGNSRSFDHTLFRSVFFTKKSLKSSLNSEDITATPHDKQNKQEEDALLFVTRRGDTTGKKRNRIPNIKISYLAGENVDFSFYKAIVMRFLHVAVQEIADQEKSNTLSNGGYYALNVTLLVPNVMRQERVSNLIKDLNEHVALESFKDKLPSEMKNTIFYIHPYSESDASFAGWCRSKALRRGNYLIVDVGKGTTDLSVVKVESPCESVGLYRSGFIGAGNVLTHAVYKSYFDQFRCIYGSSKSLENILNQSDDGSKFRLVEALEEWKGEPRMEASNSNSSGSGEGQNDDGSKSNLESVSESSNGSNPGKGKTDDIQIDTIINHILENKLGCSTPIDAAIDTLIKKILLNVKVRGFQKIILSGRAFKYNPFLVRTRQIFKEFYQLKDEDIIYDGDNAKGGCLKGPLLNDSPMVNLATNLVGIPTPVVNNDEDEKLKDEVEAIMTSASGESFAKWGKNVRWLKKKCHNLLISANELAYNISTIPDRATVNGQAGSEDIEKLLKGDLECGMLGKGTTFYLSGCELKIPENSARFDECTRYKLFFDGTHFFVRSEEESIKLEEHPITQSGEGLLRESQFPYADNNQ